jgi:hypothetical protein
VVIREMSCSAPDPLASWWLVSSLRLDVVIPVGGRVSVSCLQRCGGDPILTWFLFVHPNRKKEGSEERREIGRKGKGRGEGWRVRGNRRGREGEERGKRGKGIGEGGREGRKEGRREGGKEGG